MLTSKLARGIISFILATPLLLATSCKIESKSESAIAPGDGDVIVAPPPPSSPPPPSPAPVPAPAGVSGEVEIADNFDPSLSIVASKGIPPFSEDVGAFRMHCTAGQLGYSDPIVYPGGVSPHLHQFWGNTGTGANSTYKSLRESGSTTCGNNDGTPNPAPINRSAYWSPAMFNGKGGVVKPTFINTYYKRIEADSPMCNQNRTDGKGLGTCIGLPNGIRWVQGFNMGTHTGGPADPNSRDKSAMFFNCGTGKYSTLVTLAGSGTCAVGGNLEITAAAPNCWDGKNLDTPDHRSHMTHPSVDTTNEVKRFLACPATHPYLIPQLSIHITYTVDANLATWALSSDVQMGMTPGSTFHWDYWEAWSSSVKAIWSKECIDLHRTCSAGDLGNGTKIIKAGVPYVDGKYAFPPSEVVPIPTG